MNRLRMLVVAAAMVTAGSALASAQPLDRDGRGGDRDRYQERDRDRGRDDRRDFRDRDDRGYWDRDRRGFVDRDDHRYFVGERRFINGYYWDWDGHRWFRRDGRAIFYFSF